MAFGDGSRRGNHKLTGKWIEYDYSKKKLKTDFIEFKYSERNGFNEVIVETMDSFETASSNVTLATRENLPFKVQDKVIDQYGGEFKITDVVAEPDPRRYRQSIKGVERNKFKTKILFME